MINSTKKYEKSADNMKSFKELYRTGHIMVERGQYESALEFHIKKMTQENYYIKDEFAGRIFLDMAVCAEKMMDKNSAAFFYKLVKHYWADIPEEIAKKIPKS